ncbi:MAG: pyruvate, phosphate dikinase [Myxococcales bacterium]|nr:pyruvate, phosphate dikinase [Myxococcales bacterium]
MSGEKYVFFFGKGSSEGNASMRNLLGGKGANLAEMTNLGIPVPAGFSIATSVCTFFMEHNEYPTTLESQVVEALRKVEDAMGRRYDDVGDPLLLSVRSGARVSMPGMMDTVLNLGLNDRTIRGLIEQSGDPRFAYDSYRRFVQMYGDVVMGAEHHGFEERLAKKKAAEGVELDMQLSAKALEELVGEYKAYVHQSTGKTFPDEPMEQLWGAIQAVFGSWQNDRARTYRRLNEIPDSWGTAVNVQAMVYGNMGEDCGTGVCFTRDPSTGERRFYGEFLINAQGEDVVAGIRTPQPINRESDNGSGLPTMEATLPACYQELVETYHRLEEHYKEMQDIEFTVQKHKLWLLQTRTGKRTARAALRIAVEMVEEGLITRETAVRRIDPDQLNQLLHPMLDPSAPRDRLAKGLPASPGAASGRVVFTADEAETMAKAGTKVVLVRTETSPEDIHGMAAAEGILTSRGGMTSHAAVVARGMGKCCVAGCGDVVVDYEAEQLSVRGRVVKKHDVVTLDGSTGELFYGDVPKVAAQRGEHYEKLMSWVDEFRTLGVRANADTPHDASVAVEFGAEGIGLCRTEHMFFDGDRITAVREMILADDEAGRRRALEKILPMQRSDFVGIFEAMGERPVTIRLLDPPLHEFLPHGDAEIEELAPKLGTTFDLLKKKTQSLFEFNPMLGHRGCRLGITYPEIYEVQVRAIVEAACEVKKAGLDVHPEIMIPLVAMAKELEILRKMTAGLVESITSTQGVEVKILIGTMIELPRACVVANEIAKHAEFFSFGTNDLTQTTLGLSRDDAGKFIPLYVEQQIFPKDPFVTIDPGVADLVRIAVERGKAVRPDLKVGICGEHGGDPKSVEFCHAVGLNYVSCSPYRVPIARLAAAQAALKS